MSGEREFFVHANALCESEHVGTGTRIWAFAHVMKGAVIGRGCNVCDHAFIESHALLGNNVTVKNGVMIWDGVTIEDDVFLGPGVVFTNDLTPRAHVKKSRESFVPTCVKRGATIGANATIVCGVTVGEYAFIGAGAVVTRDVPSFAMMRGNPGRKSGWVCRCGIKLGPSLSCTCGQSYQTVAGNLVPLA